MPLGTGVEVTRLALLTRQSLNCGEERAGSDQIAEALQYRPRVAEM